MEYCLGSASDLLEGMFETQAYNLPSVISFITLVLVLLCSNQSVFTSSQETSARSGNCCNYPWCSSRVDLSSFPQHDSQVSTLAQSAYHLKSFVSV